MSTTAAAKAESDAAKVDRAKLIVEMGMLAGDVGLGAELVVVAEEYADGQPAQAHEDTLRIAEWLHERKSGRCRAVRRAFGKVD